MTSGRRCRIVSSTRGGGIAPTIGTRSPRLHRRSCCRNCAGKFPGKTDEQIVRVLRGDCPVDSSGDEKAADWLAKRLQAARKQWEAVRAIEGAGGHVYYDFEFDKSGKVTANAKPSVPTAAGTAGRRFFPYGPGCRGERGFRAIRA